MIFVTHWICLSPYFGPHNYFNCSFLKFFGNEPVFLAFSHWDFMKQFTLFIFIQFELFFQFCLPVILKKLFIIVEGTYFASFGSFYGWFSVFESSVEQLKEITQWDPHFIKWFSNTKSIWRENEMKLFFRIENKLRNK